jgi:hypothetical protein
LSGNRNISPLFVLQDKVSGVWGNDSVLAGQFGGFLAQFLVFTAQTNFIEQIPDSPRRPKSRNEIVLGRIIRRIHIVSGNF